MTKINMREIRKRAWKLSETVVGRRKNYIVESAVIKNPL